MITVTKFWSLLFLHSCTLLTLLFVWSFRVFTMIMLMIAPLWLWFRLFIGFSRFFGIFKFAFCSFEKTRGLLSYLRLILWSFLWSFLRLLDFILFRHLNLGLNWFIWWSSFIFVGNQWCWIRVILKAETPFADESKNRFFRFLVWL